MQAPDNNNNHLLCQGTTSDGLPCKRTPSASAGNGFCYQHQSQDQHDNDNDDKEQDQQSMDIEEDQVQEDVVEPVQEEPVQEEEAVVLELTRCKAIASTTKLRCKKLVSFAGEQFCPTHGGRQHKEKVLMALCQAISKTTRQPCKRRVNFAGQQFCSHHGGRKVSDANALKPTAPPPAPTTNPTMSMMDPITVARFMYQPPQFNNGNSNNNNTANTSTNSSGFDSLQLANHCVEFLSETHPRMMHACGCDAQKNVQCKSMTIIKWVQLLIKLTQGGGDVFSIRDPQAFHSLTQLGVFADLYTAVAIFDSSMDFLPALFRHMRPLGGNAVPPKREPSFPPTTPSSPLHLSPSMSSIASWSQIAPHFDDNDHHDDGNDNNVA